MAQFTTSTLQDSARTSSVPQTPQPPFDPPQRRSSLAFESSIYTTTPVSVQHHAAAPNPSQLSVTPKSTKQDVETTKLFASPLARQSPSQLQMVFRAARGVLHRDMFAASSPASSIESRMNLEHTISWQPDGNVGADTREWRYSTAPQNLAAVSTDVREPLPSPTLPDMTAMEGGSIDEITEPVSSGFASPTIEHSDQRSSDPGMVGSCPGNIASSLPRSDSHVSVTVHTPNSADETRVGQGLQHLHFDSDNSEGIDQEDSLTAENVKGHSRRQSEDRGMQISPVNSIYLSKSAEAAAESAKAKRGWLRGIFSEDQDAAADVEADEVDIDMEAQLPNLQVMCPDPLVHHLVSTTPCPEPSLHSQSPSLYRRLVEYHDSNVVFADREDYQIMSSAPGKGSHRATATGSPMPFPKLRSRLTTAYSERHSLRSPTPQPSRAQVAAVTEHFQPGWYYAREPSRPSTGPSYSFSTAASKAIGSDQAPDSRMRDSYKTDTLTALPLPTTRYRKNGIGAQVMPRGIGRYYERPSSAASARTGGFRSRPSSRQTYADSGEVRFRSSPPRTMTEEVCAPVRRKRAMDDSFMIAEDAYRPASGTPALYPSGRVLEMRTNEYVDMAVRTSVFGGSSPEALRSARQGIRELSPNVQLYRKGAMENVHLRKKRRPSYWDSDLKEVRESPAGRGGVRSPVSAQESMRAEFEVASQRDAKMADNEDYLAEATAASRDVPDSGYIS